MTRERQDLYDFDEDSWNARQEGRELYELVREPIQNSMDTGSDIDVMIRYEDNSILVEDYDSEGVRDISNFTTVYKGTKKEDPETRGRFGRGLKELVGASERALAQSTGGTVLWNVRHDGVPRKEFEDVSRGQGTMVYASNTNWSEEDLNEVKQFVEQIIPDPGMRIQVADDRGQQVVNEYEEPDRIYETVLETAGGDERETTVEVTRTPQSGGIYEMGIPVTMDEDFPFVFNVQQTVPMAEQREGVKGSYRGEILQSLVANELDFLFEDELREEHITDNLIASGRMETEVEQRYLERLLNHPMDWLAVSTTSAIDDMVEKAGYRVVDPHEDNLSSSVSTLVNDHIPTSAEVAEEMERGDTLDKDIEPSEAQQRWLEFVEEHIIDPIWEWGRNESGTHWDYHEHGELSTTLDKDTGGGTPRDMVPKPEIGIAYLENPDRTDRYAWYDPVDHAIYFNVAEAEDDWEDWYLEDAEERFTFNIPNYERLGVAVHEAAHADADSNEHDNEWIETNDLMTGKLIQKLMIENRTLRGEEKKSEPPVDSPPGKTFDES